MKSLARKRESTLYPVEPGKSPKKKVKSEPQYFVVEKSDFPYLGKMPLDGSCHMMVRVINRGHPDYSDKQNDCIKLELAEGEIVKKGEY